MKKNAAGGKRTSYNIGAFLPEMTLGLWLIFLAVVIWRKAGLSQQPPIYDSLTYLQKGLEFWRHIHAGQWVNPFNLMPVVRPPGVILMAMPFGLEEGTRGFFFRSAFWPILCTAAGTWLAAGKAVAVRERWGRALLAVLVSTLPVFYHFEIAEGVSSPAWWGMVDNFQGGMAALAMGAMLRSLGSRSLHWLGLSAAGAAMTILIKPSGGVLMLLILGAWLVLEATDGRQKDRRYWRQGLVVWGTVYGITAFLCLTSRYISRETLDFANQVLTTTRQVLFLDQSRLPELLRHSLGFHLLAGCSVLAGSIFFRQKGGTAWRQEGISLCLAGVIWVVGVWYWLVAQAGGNHIRYFTPFFLAGILLLAPAAMNRWRDSRGWCLGVTGITAIPLLVYSFLMLQPSPQLPMENWAGIHVSVGSGTAEVQAARNLVAEGRKQGRDLSVYALAAGEPADLATGVPSIIFENVGTLAAVAEPGKNTFRTRLQVDWQRGFVTRLEEMLSSEYILMQPLSEKERLAKVAPGKKVETFDEENQVFRVWLEELTAEEGVALETENQTDKMRLLTVTDRARLAKALGVLMRQYSWRNAFLAENSEVINGLP